MKRTAFAITACVVPLFAAAYACSPANPTPQLIPTTVASSAAPSGPKFATPARWVLSPAPRWQATGSVTVAPGSTLWYGGGGERWLESPKGVESAEMLFPESIVGVQQTDGMLRFIGESGAVFVAKEAIGPYTTMSKGVDHPRVVTSGKGCIVAVDANGDLMRTTDAKTWTKVEIAGREGPVVGVALGGNGGLLSTAPLHLFMSKDDGATWSPIKAPSDGVREVKNDLGTVIVEGHTDSFQLDPAYGTFTQYARPGRSQKGPHWPDAGPQLPWRRADGKRIVQVSFDGKNQRAFQVAVFEFGQTPAPKHLDILDGCDRVNAAIRGESVVLVCDARGNVTTGIDRDAGGTVRTYASKSAGLPDGGTLGMVSKIFRSEDGGQTWKEEATVEGGLPSSGEEPVVIGESGWLFLGQRCGTTYNTPCLPARVRPSFAGAFVDLPSDDTKWVRFAVNASSGNVFAIQSDGEDARLLRFRPGTTTPEDLGIVGQNSDFAATTLSYDDDGTVHGFVRKSDKRAGFTFKEGAGLGLVTLPADANRVALAGIHGLAQSSRKSTEGYETVDGGKTWGKVVLPEFVNDIDFCNERGCLLDRGIRMGWDAPAPMVDPPATKADKAAYMKPLRCSAKDHWVVVGGGWYPDVDAVDHGQSRWVMPTRTSDGTIALALNKRGDPIVKTTSVSMFGPSPGPPKFGSGTTMHVQQGGVVALRYSYPRGQKGLGRLNPVDANVAWYRDATGRVSRGAVAKIAPFRVNKDPTGETGPTLPYRSIPEVLSLGDKGVYFRPPAFDGEDDYDDNGNEKPKAATPIYLLRDDARIDKLKFPLDDPDGDDAHVVMIDGSPTLVASSSESWNMYYLNEGKLQTWSVMGGLDSDAAPVSVGVLGGKPIFVATTRSPGRSFGIAMKNDSELPASIALATQKSLGDTPKGCDGAPTGDPGTLVFAAPYTNGSRRPVVIDVDGVGHVLATKRAKVRQAQNARDACLAAFEANDDDSGAGDDFQYGALIFPDDLAHSIVFQAKVADWPAVISARPMECAYTPGPLPEDLIGTDGFVE